MPDPDDSAASLAALHDDLSSRHLAPLWPIAMGLMPTTPRPQTLAWLWRFKEMLVLAERAGELVTLERGGDRRVLSLVNPGLGGRPFATSTLWGAIQYLNPGEHAPAHRHTPGAIRFVMRGEGAYTTVDGDACHMAPGDLVLTPSMSWHDHNSSSEAPVVWFDGLDMPAVLALDAIFFESYRNKLPQPVDGHDRSRRRYGSSGLVPADEVGTRLRHSPRLVYPWADTDAALSALLEERGGPMVSLEFCDPLTGRPALPTMGCQMHRLVPSQRTSSKRKTGSSVYVVHRGSGTTVIDGRRFTWGPGDMFVTPSWSAVDHQAEEPSDMFSISDAPVLRSLQLYREEDLGDTQAITGDFDERTDTGELA